MFLTTFIMLALVLVIVSTSTKNRYSNIIQFYLISLVMLSIFATAYTARMTYYTFPLKADYAIYLAVSNLKLRLDILRRLYNISLGLFFFSTAYGFVVILNKPRHNLIWISMPILFFIFLNDPKFLLNLELKTTDGEEISVLSVGNRNFNSGADYVNARIKIGATLWAGQVEIHVRASDWFRHKHQYDDNYNNVILHVVYECDTDLLKIPTLEIKDKFDISLLLNYNSFVNSRNWIPCGEFIGGLSRRNFQLETGMTFNPNFDLSI